MNRRSITQYLIVLTIIQLLFILSFVCSNSYFEKRTSFLFSLIENENSRIELNRTIVKNVDKVSAKLEHAIHIKSQQNLDRLSEEISEIIATMEAFINIADKGGKIDIRMDVNLKNIEQVNYTISYHNYFPDKLNPVAIELRAKIYELQALANEYLKNIASSFTDDKITASRTYIPDNLSIKYKRLVPFLMRMEENANRMYYESFKDKVILKQEIDSLLETYSNLRSTLILLGGFSLTIIMLFFFAKIQSILREKKEAEINLKNSHDELESLVAERTRSLNRALEEMKKLAATDPLTKLLNRRNILEKLKDEVVRYERHRKPFVIAIADIDDFKLFNDKYGHDCGDYILVEVANKMKSSLRKQDFVARWGGEEFLIVLIETDLNNGRTVIEKIRRIIAEEIYRYQELELSVTMTFGISQFDDSMDIDACIKKADIALYKGKTNGKNCVV